MAAQMPTLTTGAAGSAELPWLSRCAHLRLVPGSSASLVPDSRSQAAVMWPQLLWLRAKKIARVGDDCRVAHKFPSSWPFYLLKNTIKNVQIKMYFPSRRPCPPTSAFAVYKSLEYPYPLPQLITQSLFSTAYSTFSIFCCTERTCKPSSPQKTISCFRGPGE